MATTVGSLSIPMGVAVGYVLPALIVQESSGKSDVGSLMLLEAFIVGVVTVLVFLLFKNTPSVAPSYAAQAKKESFKEGLRIALKNKNFLLAVLGFGLGQGTLNAFTTVVQQITSPYGYSSTDNSIFGSLAIFFGLVGSAVAGVFVTKTMKYKVTLMSILVSSAISFIILLLSLEWGTLGLVCGAVSLFGFCLMPILPIGFELGCELTFPVGEATINGIMNCSGQVFGILQILIAFAFGNSPYLVIFMGVFCVTLGTVFVLFCKEELRRIKKNELGTELSK